MIDKPFDQISKENIVSLVENAVREGRRLDYKEALPGHSDKDKREFLADVSSFANASGGDLLYGIVERRDSNKQPTGVPDSVPGLKGINVDKERLRLENMLLDGLEPRINGVRLGPVEGFEDGPVLIVRVPNSWASPHMVTFKTRSRFYARNSSGKYQMDVAEIRSSFALSEAIPERIQNFRNERIGKLIADDTPVPLFSGPKILLHLLPLASFSRELQMTPTVLRVHHLRLAPISAGGWDTRYNIDGVLTMSGGGEGDNSYRAYCQIFRNGIIEAAEASLLKDRQGKKSIPSIALEEKLIQSMMHYLEALLNLDVPNPVVVMLTLIDVRGCMMVTRFDQFNDQGRPIDRDVLLLPDILVEDYACDVPHLLKPIFDAVWNAAGYEESLNYDSDGKWNPMR